MIKNILFHKGGQPNPYSDLVIVDDRQLYLSGLIAMDLGSQEVRYGTITEETRLILDNLSQILRSYGSDMDHVVRIDVLLRDFSERDEMNAEYLRHFEPTRLPARLCYGGVALHGSCRLELCAVAVKRDP